MKKKIIILAAALMLSSLTACGEGGDKPVDTTQAVTTSSTIQSSESTATQSSENNKSENNSVELPLTSKFPLAKVYIDGPNYQIIENGSTKLYNVGGSRFIALTSDDGAKVNKPSEILDTYLEDFKMGVETNCNGSRPVKFNIKESKEIKISDIDFYRFQGDLVVNNTVEDKNCYAVGYTFIRNNIPFQVVGVVVSDEQKQEEIDEITTYVDAMVKTIRDKR